MEEAPGIEGPGDEKDGCDEDYDVRKVEVTGPAGETHRPSECAKQLVTKKGCKAKRRE